VFQVSNVIRFVVEEVLRPNEVEVLTVHGFFLIFCIMFRFTEDRDFVDSEFIQQFMRAGGPATTIKFLQSDFGVKIEKIETGRQIMPFMPMMGLSEVPEGRIWLAKHSGDIVNFLNHFERDRLKVYLAPFSHCQWCFTNDKFKFIDRVWKQFYDVIQRVVAERRERNIIELLQDEEREKVKALAKKQKKEMPKQLSPEQRKDQTTINCETIFGFTPSKSPAEEKRAAEAKRDIDLIADMFRYVPPPSPQVPVCTNGNAISAVHPPQSAMRIETNPFPKQPSDRETVKKRSPGDDWTKVQGKKHSQKDKHQSELRNASNTVPMHTQQKQHYKSPVKKVPKQKTKKQVASPVVFTKESRPVSSPSALGRHACWADVAKGKIQSPSENMQPKTALLQKQTSESSINKPVNANSQEQTALSEEIVKPSSGEKKAHPSKMLFNFFEVDAPKVSVAAEHSKPIGDLIEEELVGNYDPIAVECFMYDPEYIETETGSINNDKNKASSKTTKPVRCHGGSPRHETGDKWLEDLQAPSTDGSDFSDGFWDSSDEEPESNGETRVQKDEDDALLRFESQPSADRAKNAAYEREHEPPSGQCSSTPSALDLFFGSIPQTFEEADHAFVNQGINVETRNVYNQLPSMPSTAHEPHADIVQCDPAILGYLNKTPNTALHGHPVVDNNQRSQYEQQLPQNVTMETNQYKQYSANDAQAHQQSQRRYFQPHVLFPNKNANQTRHSTPVTNSAFGQQLLYNACRLQEDHIDDEVLFPESLDGTPLDDKSPDATSDDRTFFPSIHDGNATDFLQQCNDAGFAAQRIQKQQVVMFYEQNKADVMNPLSLVQDQFIYKAQLAGFTTKEIAMFISGNVIIENYTNGLTTHELSLPFKGAENVSKQSDRLKTEQSSANVDESEGQQAVGHVNKVAQSTVSSKTESDSTSTKQKVSVGERQGFAPLLSQSPGVFNSQHYRKLKEAEAGNQPSSDFPQPSKQKDVIDQETRSFEKETQRAQFSGPTLPTQPNPRPKVSQANVPKFVARGMSSNFGSRPPIVVPQTHQQQIPHRNVDQTFQEQAQEQQRQRRLEAQQQYADAKQNQEFQKQQQMQQQQWLQMQQQRLVQQKQQYNRVLQEQQQVLFQQQQQQYLQQQQVMKHRQQILLQQQQQQLQQRILQQQFMQQQQQQQQQPQQHHLFHQQFQQQHYNECGQQFAAQQQKQQTAQQQKSWKQQIEEEFIHIKQDEKQEEQKRQQNNTPKHKPLLIQQKQSSKTSNGEEKPTGPLYGSCTPGQTAANVRLIQAQQTAMTQAIVKRINDVYHGMVLSGRMRSVRWEMELQRLRNLPAERLLIIDRIVIPRYDADRSYIAYHRLVI